MERIDFTFYVMEKGESDGRLHGANTLAGFISIIDALTFAQEKADRYNKRFLILRVGGRPKGLIVDEVLEPKGEESED